MTHAILSASGSTRWMNCPGSIRLGQGITVDRTSIYAEEGTAAHMVAERCLREEKPAVSMLGVTVTTDAGSEFEVTEDMAEHVQVYLDAVRAAVGKAHDPTLHIEQQFKLDHLYPNMWGTNDAAVVEPLGVLHLFDLKYGQGVVVEVEDNTQFMYYALGATGMYGHVFEEVRLTVVQPRAYHEDGPVRTWVTTTEALEEWAHEVLIPAAKRTEEPDAPLVTGDHCRWCKAHAICPEQRNEIVKATGSGAIDPSTLSDEQLSQALELWPRIEAWGKSLKTHAFGVIKNGGSVPGWKMVEGKAHRKWTHEPSTEASLSEQLGEDLYKRSVLTPAQVEKMLAKKGHTKKEAKALVEPLVTVTRGESLAPDSDSRRAVVNDATAMFANVRESENV